MDAKGRALMNTVFFGASSLGYDCCETLLKNGVEITGIFSIREQFNISYSPGKPVKNYLFKDFSVLAKEYNIPYISIDGKLGEFLDEFKKMEPHFILAIGWYYMIPNSFLEICNKGGAGIHASLLPKYRGNAPLVWAMINGEKETGVSFFYFSEGVDEGDIIGQEKFEISESDTIKEVLEKTTVASKKVLLDKLPEIANGTNIPTKQDHSKATLFPKRSPEDGEIDWSKSPKEINNFIRAQTKPYPGAFTIINGKKVKIWSATVSEESEG